MLLESVRHSALCEEIFDCVKLEIERNLEQLRALDNGMTIHVGLTKSLPLSVDTDKDLGEIKKFMNNEKK